MWESRGELQIYISWEKHASMVSLKDAPVHLYDDENRLNN